MAYLSVSNTKIVGVSAAVPKGIESNLDLEILGGLSERQHYIDVTGVAQRHIVKDSKLCTSDLCYHAAEKLIKELGWNKEDIDCLIFVTQTPDYIIPATSCILQQRLGLSMECYALDISLGCSGWIYGLSTITSLLSSGNLKKALLLSGDTVSITKSEMDKSTYPLFGDAGTATAVVYELGADNMYFHLATDGSNYDSIIIEDGGFRNFFSNESLIVKECEPGVYRNKLQSYLNGANVFTFGITKAPASMKGLMEKYCIDINLIDYFVFHQANLFLNEKIRSKLKLASDKVPYCLNEFGNTSSASIPLTIVSRLKDKFSTEKLKIAACGFGVGLSWGSSVFTIDKILCTNIIEL